MGWAFKATVKGALKAGNSITVDLKLCVKPYMGLQAFVLHWTPLKDGKGEVGWVVLMLGNEQRA